MFARLAGFFLLAMTMPLVGQAGAQSLSWQDEWKNTLEKAKGQSLSVSIAPEEAYTTVMAEFSSRFPIKAEPTIMRPSSALARIQTEQQSGQFTWDVWMGGTSNMVNSAAPAGLLAPMEPYFILPEVKDPANWRHPDFLFGDAGRRVFTNANRVEFYVLRNTSVVPEAKLESWDDFLNPKFKGKISIRDLSVPNGGTFAVATGYGVMGPDFVRRLLKDQEPKFFENPQQLETAVVRGGQAIAIGLESYIWDKCRADGGCKDVEQLRQFAAATSAGLSIPKNPPHPEAMKVFVNWYLSKEGQEVWVNARAKQNNSGAVSMRKDVAPFKGHESSLPDFSNPRNYVFVSSEKGSEEVDATIKIFKEITGH